MPTRNLLTALLLVFIALASTACPKNIPPPDNPVEQPTKLRNLVESRTDSLEDARFKEVVLDYFGKEDRIKVRQLILVDAPRSIRVQTRLPGGNEIVSLLVANAEKFSMHERRDNKYYTGPPTRENINRLLPVDLSARDVVRVMVGGGPWDRFDRQPGDPKLRWDRQTGTYELSVKTNDGGKLSLHVRHTDYAVTRVVQRDSDDSLVYKYTTDDWERIGSVALPTYRRFVWPERDLDFSLDVGETHVNVGFPSHLFQLSRPAGSEVILVDDGTPPAPTSPDD